MKTESKTLVWGTIIAITLVTGEWLLVTKFPTFHFPISSESIKFGLASVVLAAVLVFAYRSLLRRGGFWLLLCAVLIVHVGAYALVFSKRIMVPIQADIFYGIMAGIEFIGFALLIFKIYHVGPNIKWL